MSNDIFIAVKTRNSSFIEECLAKTRDPNVRNKKGLAPIHISASLCDLKALHLLIERHHADVNLLTSGGLNALHFALDSNYNLEISKVVAYLVDKGVDLNNKTSTGWSPLHVAAHKGYIKCVKILLLKGCNVLQKDCKGLCPHEVAKLACKKKCHSILFQSYWDFKKKNILLQKRELERVKKVYNGLLEEALEQLNVDQVFCGTIAHDNWLEDKSIDERAIEVGHFDTLAQPQLKVDGVRKKLMHGDKDDMVSFVDCSSRLESMTYNLKHSEHVTPMSNKSSVIKCQPSLNKPKSVCSALEEADRVDDFVTPKSLESNKNICKPLAENLKHYVEVARSENKPVGLKVKLVGKKDIIFGDFSDLYPGEVDRALVGEKGDRQTKLKDVSILNVKHKKVTQQKPTDAFKHMKHSLYN